MSAEPSKSKKRLQWKLKWQRLYQERRQRASLYGISMLPAPLSRITASGQSIALQDGLENVHDTVC